MGKTIILTDEEYNLLIECLKWNLYFYKKRIKQFHSQIQQEQLNQIEELNEKLQIGKKKNQIEEKE